MTALGTVRHSWVDSLLQRIASLMVLLMVAMAPRSPAQPIVTAPRPATTNQPDPLAAFMITQPPIDTTAPVVVEATFEPRVIALGQSAVYRVVLNVMEQYITWPNSTPAPENCAVRKGASGQFLRNLGSSIVPQTTFLYHIKPNVTGTVKIPSFTIQARGEEIQIPAAELLVLPEGSVVPEEAPRIQLTTSGDTFYVGQNVELQALFLGMVNGSVRTLTQVEITGDNLIVDRNFRTQRIEMRSTNGVSIPTFVFGALATPMRPGRMEVTAQGMLVGSAQRQAVVLGSSSVAGGVPIYTTGNFQTYTLVDSDPLNLTILALPAESELPGFTGAIGSFSIDRPTLSTNQLQAGDLLTLSVTLRGTGNLERVLPPVIESQPQWQVFQPQKADELATFVRQRGFVTFEYKLIPLDPEINSTPAIPFCYFDPEARQFVELTVQPIPITVTPSSSGDAVSKNAALVENRSILRSLIKKPEEPKSLASIVDSQGRKAASLKPLHQRVWFGAVQAVPAVLLGGLWLWDRRRRFLEEHPEVVVRRRARKAIRRHCREARRAAKRSDAKQFLQHAIQGFREAGAPAIEADPRALVANDVLAALPTRLRTQQTREVVTTLFESANQWRFGELEPDRTRLLGLAQTIDSGLNQLRKEL